MADSAAVLFTMGSALGRPSDTGGDVGVRFVAELVGVQSRTSWFWCSVRACTSKPRTGSVFDGFFEAEDFFTHYLVPHKVKVGSEFRCRAGSCRAVRPILR